MRAAAFVLLVLALAAWGGRAGTAEAHATIVRSDPPVNARLIEPPTTVTAFFSESLDDRLSSMKVVDGSGEQVDSGEITFGPEPTQMSVAVEDLQPSFYAVQWETLSTVDGHLLNGSFPFTILNADGTEPEGPRPSTGLSSSFKITDAEPADVVTKWINILGGVLLVGGIGFGLAVAGPASRSLPSRASDEALIARRRHLSWAVWVGLLLLAGSGLAELLLQADRLGGFRYLDEALDTGWGEHWVERQVLVGAMAAAFSAFLVRGARYNLLGEAALFVSFCGGVLYLLVVALVSHGASVPGSFWAIAIDFIHLLAGAVWIGMLIQLALLLVWVKLRQPIEEQDELMLGHLRRFSPFAATSVAILLASGSGNALAELPDLSALADTVYGRVLLVKLIVVIGTLAVAGINAFFVRPRLTSPKERSGEPSTHLKGLLWRMVRIEIGLAMIVLLVTAALIQYPTGRQQRSAEANVEASEEAGSFNAIQTAGDIDIQLSITPNQVGTNSFLLYVFPPSRGEPAEISRVTLQFQPPDPSLGPSQIIAEETEPNSYKAIGPFFNDPGGWRIQVHIRRVEVDDLSTEFNVNVTGIGAGGESDRFDFPLQAGSWASASAVLAILGIIVVAVWVTQWPSARLPRRSAD